MLIDKRDLPIVAEDFMNDVHYEDIEIINDLYESVLLYEKEQTIENKNLVVIKYGNWFEHTVNHFQGEEEKMLELNFPPYLMHKGEHERCLDIMKDVIDNFIETENVNAIKKYLEEDLIEWLVVHIQTMDTITASFFKTGMSPCQMALNDY